MNPKRASRLRQKVSHLRKRRESIERALLQRWRMLRASFIERYLGTKEHKRQTPACYLSCRIGGKAVLVYVKQKDRKKQREHAQQWARYLGMLAEWVKLSKELEACFRQLGEAQAEEVKGVEK